MDKLFEKYRKRLKVFAILKSILLALAIAFIIMGITSSITWIAKASIPIALSLACGLGGLTFLVAIFPIYFKHFRPTTEIVAKKLDALGFEERYITMYENQDRMSFMAKLQREDAKNNLSKVPVKCLKFSIAIPVIMLLAFSVVFAAGTTTGAILSVVNSSSSDGNVKPPEDKKEYFTVTYKVFEEGTGTIEGELVQKVEKGHYTTSVTAISATGYRFSGWVDEEKNFLANQNNPRAEVNVHENLTIFALFEEKNNSDDDDDNESGGGEGEGDKKPEPGGGGGENPDSGGSQGGGGEGTPGGGEGQGRENNKVIDGTVDYKDNFERDKLEQELVDKDFPDELKDILGDYYGTLKP